MVRRARAILVVVVTACAATAGAFAASAAAPQASLLVLSAGDFPQGATAAGDENTALFNASTPHTSADTRLFSSASYRGTPLVVVITSAIVARNTASVAGVMHETFAAVSTLKGRKAIAAAALSSLGATQAKNFTTSAVVRARMIHVPDEAIDIVVKLGLKTGGALGIGELIIGKGTDLMETVYDSTPTAMTKTLAASLATTMDKHFGIAAATTPPAMTTAPTVEGTAAVGQTLKADTGTWTGDAEFSTQWLLCSPTTPQCTAIANATGPTYTVVSANVGSTIEVDVTATNGAGTTDSQSVPTAAIS